MNQLNTKAPFNNNVDLAIKYICQWHYDRNLIESADDFSQTRKLFEEFIELVAAQMPGAAPNAIAQEVINMTKALEGKVAIITGGGTGIGEACADMFAAEGAHVVVSGRTLDTIQKVAERIGGTAIQCDVSKYEEVVALFAKAKEIKGTVDVLVNNAGFLIYKLFDVLTMVDLVSVFKLNVLGALRILARSAVTTGSIRRPLDIHRFLNFSA